jgi:hypothetical protein
MSAPLSEPESPPAPIPLDKAAPKVHIKAMSRKKTVTIRPTYRSAVYWLAANDETAEHDANVIASFTTTILAADLFGAPAYSLAVDVVRARHGAGPGALPEALRCGCEG